MRLPSDSQPPKTESTINQAGESSREIGEVMNIANAHAAELVAEGVLASASLNDEAGESSCLTLTVHGEAIPFYVQPMYPELEEDEERYIELYLERDHPDWNPFPFAIRVEGHAEMASDIDRMLRTIGAWSTLV